MVIAGVLQHLQIADDIKSKVTLEKDGPHVVALVASGGVELGITQTSIALSKPGLTYVGTLPRDVLGDQLWGVGAYAIGVVTGGQGTRGCTSPGAIHVVSSGGSRTEG